MIDLLIPTTALQTAGAALKGVAQAASESQPDLLGNALQVAVMAAIPVLGRFLQRYVNASTSEKNVDTIGRLASAAIDYVEHAALRQQLDPDLEDGLGPGPLDKLTTATTWLERELKRTRIKMPVDEAEQWVKSELQRRVDELPPTRLIQKIASAAVDEVLTLAEAGKLMPPPGEAPLDYWSGYAADRLKSELTRAGSILSSEDASMWIRTAWMDSQMVHSGAWRAGANLTTEALLLELKKDADDYLGRIEAHGVTVTGEDVGWYLRVSRMLTEAAWRGVKLSVEEIFTAASDEHDGSQNPSNAPSEGPEPG